MQSLENLVAMRCLAAKAKEEVEAEVGTPSAAGCCYATKLCSRCSGGGNGLSL